MTQDIINNGPTLPAVFIPDGDAQPRGEIREPSYESLAGLPEGFLDASDVAGLPWLRRRHEEWTDAPTRAAVIGWITGRLKADPKAITWHVEELASAGSGARDPRLVIKLFDANRDYRAVGLTVMEEDRNPERIIALLASAEAALIFP